MNEIVDIQDHYTEGDNWYGAFECPNCNTDWGASNDGDPPATVVEYVRCTCNAVLKVSGEWVSNYCLEADLVEEEE